ncbi:MAG: geranylgeranylglyceryl/heptaprenylglyceryl phosphate synthase [Bernardetiaceae bacterium]|nr:geranylgeranylglyceryl/heptaprenylglyceryl phosphate synthase [Bernardetiaceae bacterium]
MDKIKKQKIKHKKSLIVLLDPDKLDEASTIAMAKAADYHAIEAFFVGGSLMSSNRFEQTVSLLKAHSKLPIIIFPGNYLQISAQADALLLLSLLSGRNPEFLIGQHVVAAPYLKRSGLEIIPTAYLLIDCGTPTSVSYMSQTQPIPYEKNDIAVATAVAGEMMGMQLAYLEGGSGAIRAVPDDMIRAVSQAIDIPLIVGGGIRDIKQLEQVFKAGADIAVVGTSLEKKPDLLSDLSKITNTFNR